MEVIDSFKIDHTKLNPGLYVSRVDHFGHSTLTTYDLRFKRPNIDHPMKTGVMHTIEHIGATFLRLQTDEPVVYFGPMGCRTGFYLITASEPDLMRTLDLVRGLCNAVLEAKTIPGCTKEECGNAADHNLSGAKEEAKRYRDSVLNEVQDENDFRLDYFS